MARCAHPTIGIYKHDMHSGIIFTSNQSILVEVVVHSEDLTKGETKVTNTGWLWYVPLAPPDVNSENKDWYIAKVPSMPTLNEDDAMRAENPIQQNFCDVPRS